MGTIIRFKRLEKEKQYGPPKHGKMRYIRFHDRRHTFASWYVIEKDNIWELKGILGHADIMTTQQYAHLSSQGAHVPNFSWKG